MAAIFVFTRLTLSLLQSGQTNKTGILLSGLQEFLSLHTKSSELHPGDTKQYYMPRIKLFLFLFSSQNVNKNECFDTQPVMHAV